MLPENPSPQNPAVPALPAGNEGDSLPPGGPQPYWQTPDRQACLYRGDCREVLAALPTDCIDYVWTDPPYHLSNDGGSCSAGRRVSVNKGSWDRSQGLTADRAFTREWLAALQRVLKPGAGLQVTATLHNNPLIAWTLWELGFREIKADIWEKANPPPNLSGRCFAHATETLWSAVKPDPSQEPLPPLFSAASATIWRGPAAGPAEKQRGRHPTQKPLALVKAALTAAALPPGSRVLDPFAGSATTGVAARERNLAFLGIEVDPEHLATAVRRLQAARPSPAPWF